MVEWGIEPGSSARRANALTTGIPNRPTNSSTYGIGLVRCAVYVMKDYDCYSAREESECAYLWELYLFQLEYNAFFKRCIVSDVTDLSVVWSSGCGSQNGVLPK